MICVSCGECVVFSELLTTVSGCVRLRDLCGFRLFLHAPKNRSCLPPHCLQDIILKRIAFRRLVVSDIFQQLLDEKIQQRDPVPHPDSCFLRVTAQA